ncbi:MAG: pitrilysin family protein [Clostridia bacterium]
MNKVENTNLFEEYFEQTLESGLKVILYPKKDFTSTYAIFGTKYGSINNEFIESGKAEKLEVPAGIAHFLEHKLFEGQDGSAFLKYAKYGASANAYTSFDKTAYLFSCTENFSENLKILLNFVTSPYFTKENVEKEQGIISEEISMYDDMADWRVLFGALECAYQNHPVKIDIAGTKDTIAKITPELLYSCYNNFYDLSQMVLCITGNFDKDKALELIQSEIKSKSTSTVKRVFAEEPYEINKKKTTIKLSVNSTQFMLGIKDDPKFLTGLELCKKIAETEILLSLICSKSSKFYNECYEKGLINNSFNYEYMESESFGITLIGGECDDPDEFYSLFFKEVESLLENGINNEDFLRYKKALYGRLVMIFNDVEGLANNLQMCYFINTNIFEMIDVYKNVTLSDITNRLKTHFNEKYAVLSVVEPIN